MDSFTFIEEEWKCSGVTYKYHAIVSRAHIDKLSALYPFGQKNGVRIWGGEWIYDGYNIAKIGFKNLTDEELVKVWTLLNLDS